MQNHPTRITQTDNSNTRKSKLLQLIDEKLAKAKNTKGKRTKPTPSTKSEVNRQNGANSTGPKSAEGKAKASANSLKHGFFANTDKLHPNDSPAYQALHHDLRMGLTPDGPVEEHLIQELAMFSARLKRLEAAEYALLMSNIETNPDDAREYAAAYVNNATALAQLQKAELHLRRAYNRTWDRLERMQKERNKLPLDEARKRSQHWLTYCREKANIDQPERTSVEKGKLIKHEPGHPMYRPNGDNEKSPDNSDH